jgi:hypothetical protein
MLAGIFYNRVNSKSVLDRGMSESWELRVRSPQKIFFNAKVQSRQGLQKGTSLLQFMGQKGTNFTQTFFFASWRLCVKALYFYIRAFSKNWCHLFRAIVKGCRVKRV